MPLLYTFKDTVSESDGRPDGGPGYAVVGGLCLHLLTGAQGVRVSRGIQSG